MLEIFYHPIYTNGISKDSNFPRDRYQLIFESISKSNKNHNIKFRTPEKIKIDDVYRVHQKKYVDDFIDGLMIMLDKGKHLGIYNIGNMEEIAIRDIAFKVVGHFGREAEILIGDLAPGETVRRCPDIKKIEDLGFLPKINFDQGLESIANWYEKNSENHLFESNSFINGR